MKDYLQIDNNKIDYLKKIKSKYDNGEISKEEAIADLKSKFDYITASEIALVEQELMLFKEKKNDIQAIVDIFTPLIRKEKNELASNHPIKHYLLELEELTKIINKIKILSDKDFILNPYLEQYEKLLLFKNHLTRKQMQLYPTLEAKGFDRPSKIMWTLDDYVRDEIKEVYQLLKDSNIIDFLAKQKALIADLIDLIAKEKDILYPTALELLSDSEFQKMALNDYEIGYFIIEVEKPKKENNLNDKDSGFAKELQNLLNKYQLKSASEELDVATGKMTLEQINLVFKNMPVDITYVDENEIVKFYTDTKERVFPRSKGVIGREVKNCHPAKSVHIVEEIIEKFRNGQEDEAEFWINKPNVFIYIKYLAIRDENNNFRGILEMMQDCSRIRSLQGSRTLLTWEDETKDELVTKLDSTELDINQNTKLKVLIESYPNFKDFLIKLNPSFKILNSPLGKVMLPKADLKIASERANMDVKELIQQVQKFISNNK